MSPTLLRTLVITLLLLLPVLAQPAHTRLSFYVQHEVESDQDYLQMHILVNSQDTSLKNSLAEAAASVAFVRTQAEQYCKTYTKSAVECKEVSEYGKFKVEPIYRTIRGEPVFIGFLTSYEVTVKILQPANLGTLVDKLNRREGVAIQKLEWKDAQEQDYELLAIDEGLDQAEKRCKDIGGVLEEIESVEEVPNFEEEEKPKQDGEEEEPEEEEKEIIKFKFVVKCLAKDKKK